jgi:O-antigen/teichoic acid export membrane protein
MQNVSFAFQAFQVSRYGSLLLGAVLMAWMGASKGEISSLERFSLVAGATSFFWLGGMLDGFLLLYKSASGRESRAVLGDTVQAMLLFSLLSATVFWVVGWRFYSSISMGMFGAYAVYHCCETLGQLFPYAWVAQNQPRPLLLYSILGGAGYVACILLPLVFGWGLKGILALLLLLGVAKLVFGFRFLEGRSFLSGSGESYRALWRISAPLVLAALLSQGAAYVDGFLVDRFFPEHFVDFRYGTKEFPLVLLLANSMSIVCAAEIAGSRRNGNVASALAGLRKSSDRLAWMLFPVSIALMLVSGPVFGLAFKGRFLAAVPVFDLFLLLAIPRLMFPQAVVRGFHRTFAMTFSAGVEFFLNVTLSLVLMREYGIAGIAAGTVVAFMVEKVILLAYVKFRLGVPWEAYASVPLWGGWSIALVFTWIVKYMLHWP